MPIEFATEEPTQLTDEQIIEAYQNYRAFSAMRSIFGHTVIHDEAEAQEVTDAYNILWEELSFGLGSRINWVSRDPSSKQGKMVRQAAQRLNIPEHSLLLDKGEVDDVLAIWTGELASWGLRFEWDYDIPCDPPNADESKRLAEMGEKLDIKSKVEEYYSNRNKANV